MKIKRLLPLASVLALILGLDSCTEDIDTSSRYTFTEYTVESYLAQHDTTYSEYLDLLSKVKISSRSESSVRQLLSARGNYTVFAPSNKAIHDYLDSLTSKGIITAPSWDAFPNERTLDSIQKVIVMNSIIDGGDHTEAYQTSSFPNDSEEFLIANLNDRKLSVNYGVNADSVYINGIKNAQTQVVTGGSLVDLKNRDIVAINGCIHQVHQVVAPSNQTLGELLKDMADMNDAKLGIMARLVIACGLQDTLSKIKDEVYEAKYLNGDVKNVDFNNRIGYLPRHRKYGFTLFAVPNTFWTGTFGKAAEDITLEDVRKWVVNQGFYPNAKDDADYTNPDNVLNQFVSYHILPMRIPVDKLVIHYNEKGYYYKPSSNPHTVPIWEIYTTMGKPRLLKIYEGGKGAPAGIYLNRFPNLDNGRHGTYHELNCDGDKQGVLVNTVEATNVFNGFIYPISGGVLSYGESTRANFQKQRLRYNVAGLYPEFMNNDIRANRVGNPENGCVGIPCTKTYNYIDGLDIADGSNFYYLLGLDRGWHNWQGDEFNVTGRYEMTFRLPPVPMKGIYEIRYAVQNNSNLRSMCQVYFGADKNRMPAIGIPLDLRIGGQSEILGWQADQKDDDINAEIDKKMRNNGFMKGAEHYHAGTASSPTARATQTTTRRIIVRQEMDPDKTYYLKFKSVLDAQTLEFFMDYLEFCAKEVYDNPNTPEDIW